MWSDGEAGSYGSRDVDPTDTTPAIQGWIPPFDRIDRQMFLLARVPLTANSRSGGGWRLPSRGPSRLGRTIDPASCSRFPTTNGTLPILSMENRRRVGDRLRPDRGQRRT